MEFQTCFTLQKGERLIRLDGCMVTFVDYQRQAGDAKLAGARPAQRDSRGAFVIVKLPDGRIVNDHTAELERLVDAGNRMQALSTNVRSINSPKR
ncbi:MAG: hypothetical protein JNN11_02900 [Candidatus Doudnabacteria bacterium]|nr:hypothetical protein [Candidatus Doudnabacteria bacterium]